MAAQQQTARLFDGRARILRKRVIGSATDWMADHDKFVLWHAGDAAHQPGRADEGLRHHGYRRYSLPLRCNRIMQTAR